MLYELPRGCPVTDTEPLLSVRSSSSVRAHILAGEGEFRQRWREAEQPRPCCTPAPGALGRHPALRGPWSGSLCVLCRMQGPGHVISTRNFCRNLGPNTLSETLTLQKFRETSYTLAG